MLTVFKRLLRLRANAALPRVRSIENGHGGAPAQPSAPSDRLAAEPAIVAFDDREIFCTYKSKAGCSVKWQELCDVEIVTTDGGENAEDLFWILVGAAGSCVVPGSAVGCDRLLARLQQLPEFDNVQVIRAMSSTRRGRFICWRRSG